MLWCNFYVDDLLKTVPTPARVTRLAGQLIELCAKEGFNLTKFISNERNVLAEIPAEERAVPASLLDLDELPVNWALKVESNIALDKFGFKIADLNKPNTMRCAVYDLISF